jgi:hypothetical protein
MNMFLGEISNSGTKKVVKTRYVCDSNDPELKFLD